MNEPLLHVRDLSKRFGGLVANDNIDLAVNLAEIHALIGPNGAGKTTLIAQIAGELIRPPARYGSTVETSPHSSHTSGQPSGFPGRFK